MRIQIDVAPRHAPGILAGMVHTNLLEIREAHRNGRLTLGAFPVLSGIGAGRIIYVEADPSEDWKTWSKLQQDGGGDCEDLVPAVAAELIWNKILTDVVAYQSGTSPDGSPLWHVVLRYRPRAGAAWVYGDPSRMAGMR